MTLGASALAVVGGLLLAGSVSGVWVRSEVDRRVGDVSLAEAAETSGLAFAPLGIALGLLALVLGLAVIAARGLARQIAAGLLTGAGTAAGGVVITGIGRALRATGSLTAAPWLAAGGSLLVVAAGVIALRRPARVRLARRYDIDQAPQDSEWNLASVENADDPPPTP